MSQAKKSVATKDEAAPVSPVAEAASDDAKSSHSQAEVKELKNSLKMMSQKRRILRQVQITYSRIKKSFFKVLKSPAEEEEKADKVEDKKTPKDPVDAAKEKVKAAHRLLRNFNYAVNVQVMDRDDDKRVFPKKFEEEMESLFDDNAALEKIKKALQTDIKESHLKEIPDKLSEKTLKAIVDFLEKHEKVEVIDKLEVQLTDLTKQIDEKKEKLNALRPERKKNAKSNPSSGNSKKSKNSMTKKSTSATLSDPEQDESAEEKFRHLIKQVNQRVKAVKLKKDDYELYVNMQQEIDAFLHEAISEISAIQTRFKKRFDDIQNGKSSPDRRRQSRSRSNRRPNRRNADPSRS